MLNQSKVSKSPRTQKSIFGYSIDESSYTRSFLQCDVTRTPRRDIFATPPKHRLLNSTPRYSLSEVATPPRASRRDYSRTNYLKNCTGPLLASTRFNVNISTYEDAKSPGLASRIVQYNEEAEREKEYKRPSTHQAKYGSPGVFPVVHLFKKDLPKLEQKPRRNSLHLSTPEHIRHQSPEYNRKLMEGIIRPSSASMGSQSFIQPNGKSSPSTRSVLDALKEISRKRIHAHEELDLTSELSKRERLNQVNGDSNKRYRDASPTQDESTNSTKPPNKKLCVYDEYAASCSSMDFSFTKKETPVSKRKSVDSSTSTENADEENINKYINAETQTTLVDDGKDKVDISQKNNIPVLTLADRLRKEEPVKSYEDDPLERIRKQRLAALPGGNVESQEQPTVPTLDTVLKEPIPVQPEKPLVSILTNNKSFRKSDKHVHFSIPESTTKMLSNSDTPINVETSVNINNSTIVNTSLETPAPPSSPVNLQPTASDASVAASQDTFRSISSTSLTPPKVLTTDTNTSVPKINFDFTKTLPPSGPINNQLKMPAVPQSLSTGAGYPKVGGFKFDLNKSSATVPPSATINSSVAPSAVVSSTSANISRASENTIAATNATFSFGNLTSKQDTNTLQQFGSVAGTTATNTSLLNPNTSVGFGNSTNVSIGMNFGTSTTTTSFSSPITSTSASPFKFGPSNSDASVKSMFGASQPSTSVDTPIVKTLGLSSSTVTTEPSKFNVTTATLPSFGVNKPVFSFGSTANPDQTNSAPTFKFGATTSFVTSSTSTLVSTSPTSTFGTALTSTTTTSSFGSTSSAGGFGSGLNSTGFGNTAVANAFGSSNNNTSFALPTTSTVAFATAVPNTPVGFGIATTTIPSFGNQSTTTNTNFAANKTPLFGGTQPTAFGTSAPTTSSGSGFGVPVSTTPFGTNTPAFGATTTKTPFGITTNVVSFNSTVTTTTAFGDKSNLPSFGIGGGFGTQPSNIFVSTNAQPTGFGTQSSAPIFGQATSSPFGNNAVNTSAPTFGSNTTPTFTFGAKTTTSSAFTGNSSFGSSFGANSFGTTNPPSFGAPVSTQSNSFGTSNTPSFGTASNSFGTNKSIFGSSAAQPFETPSTTLAFGAGTVTPAFGATAPNTGFGSNSTAPTFGATTPGAAFAKPQATPATFGSSNAFGATNTGFNVVPPATQANVFSFGSGNAAPTKPTGFSFAAATGSVDPPKPTFNFTSGATNPPAFGSSSNTTFSNTPNPNFGATQFGAAQPAAPVFNIGSAPPSSNRARTHLKAKRRT